MSLGKRQMKAERETKRAAEKQNCGCTFNWDDKFEVLCPQHEESELWGEIISTYTDTEAQDDGIIVDVADLGVKFNGATINRATVGAVIAAQLKTASAREILHLIAQNSDYDGDGSDAWGIFAADVRFGNERLWLIPNENDGYTLMLPNEY